ncbi:Uncharacterised protein [Corynebacterium imitans]|uniref:Uncharacterized protein n=1 Tax=Corynebacterium imitans TaxID=156978 RepID=A0A076NKS7_9CORY|nr:hypothetical protein [Corynebacterium imitans]AIJ33988.1 hypothetical protein CIMIT_08810 [Corynebacterium imitans]SNV78192.1 Uncharacterised protein [Corynebacterium imitans]
MDDDLQLRVGEARDGTLHSDYAGITLFVQELIDELDGTYEQLLFEANRDEKLLKGIAKREREIERLKRKISSLESTGMQLEAEVQKLKNTKGYKLQTLYWRLRKAKRK